MPTSSTGSRTRSLIAALAVGAAAVLTGAPAGAEEILSSIARGGRLYENWHVETGEHARRISHLKATALTGAAGSATDRCVDCHGWDYLGKDGAGRTSAKGLSAYAGGDPAAVIAIIKDKTHGYGPVLTDEDLRDLANFVTRGQVEMSGYIDTATGRAKGDFTQGVTYYQTICANCHGADGLLVDSIPPLGEFARREPLHALHVMLNGHPNGSMPALRALSIGIIADTLAYIQTLPDRDMTASVVRGGRLYDNWMKETGKSAPQGLPPALLARGRTEAADGRSAQAWRCVDCHGWDYKGKDGTIASGTTKPQFGGIQNMVGANPDAIVKILNDANHQYGRLLSMRDLYDLANFVSGGQVDSARYIDAATGKVKADPAMGEPYYQTICATCHGAEGRDIRTMPPLGRMATENPWHSLHGVFNGHPGEAMPPLRAMPDIIGGVLAFTQTLPVRK